MPAKTGSVSGEDCLGFENLKLSSVSIGGQLQLSYKREGTGPTLIFIHGAMGDLRSWAPQWHAFSPRFDCISYSRRYSFPNPNPMNSRTHNALVDAADLEGLMDALSVEKAVLIGSSYGGFTALAMGIASAQRVSAIVAVEPPMMRYGEMRKEGREVVAAFREQTVLPARAAFEAGDNELGVVLLTGGIAGKDVGDIPGPVMERRMQNIHAARSLSLSDDEFPLLEPEALADLSMPVLLMSGADTAPIHRVIFDGVCAAMPKAEVRIVDSSGHSVSQAQSQVFNEEVLAFLERSDVL